MSTVRDNDFRPLGVTMEKMILSHNHETGQFAMCTGTRVECKSGHSGYCGQGFLHVVINLESTLYGRFRLKRMKSEEARHCCDFLIDLRVVLHRTASERIESGINAEVHLRKIGIVSYDIHLTDLRKSESGLTGQ